MRLEFRRANGVVYAVLLLGCPVIVFFGLGAFAIGYPVTGWFFLVGSVLALLRWGRYLLVPNPIVIIDDVGIWDRRMRVGKIPWEQIVQVEAHWIFADVALNIHVYNEAVFINQLGLARRLYGGFNRISGRTLLAISFTSLKPNIEVAIKHIDEAGVLEQSD